MAFDGIALTLSCLLTGGLLATFLELPRNEVVRAAAVCAAGFWAFVLLLSGSLAGLILGVAAVLIASPWRFVGHRDAT